MESTTNPFLQYLPYLIPVILLQLVLMIVALVDLSRREKVRWLPKWGWALIVIFIQMIGPIVYFIFGRAE